MKSDSGEDRKAVGKGEIEGEGEGEGEGAKEEEGEGLGDELIKKEEEEEEEDEKMVQPMSDKEPAEGGTGGEEGVCVCESFVSANLHLSVYGIKLNLCCAVPPADAFEFKTLEFTDLIGSQSLWL